MVHKQKQLTRFCFMIFSVQSFFTEVEDIFIRFSDLQTGGRTYEQSKL